MVRIDVSISADTMRVSCQRILQASSFRPVFTLEGISNAVDDVK